jgi:hypothetical protein
VAARGSGSASPSRGRVAEHAPDSELAAGYESTPDESTPGLGSTGGTTTSSAHGFTSAPEHTGAADYAPGRITQRTSSAG